MDEKVMMMEQERLAREAKRKKNRKRLRMVSLIVLVFLVIVTVLLVVRRNRNEVQENTVQIVVPAGQEVIYAELTGVKGNEITYRMATEREDTEQTEGAEVPRGEETRGERPDMGQMRGEMPDMSQMGGEMPDMSQVGGQMPDFGGGMFQNGERTEDEESFTYDGVTYVVAGEEITTLIPVGTDVTTKLGAVTTFSRLTAGDMVALVMAKDAEERIITAVYIID